MARTNQSAGRIVNALMELINEQSYSDISIADITRAAGVSRITFYRNFSSREDVMSRSIEHVVGEIQTQVREKGNKWRLREYIETVLEGILPYVDVIRQLYEAHLGELVQKYFDRYLLASSVCTEVLEISEYERSFFVGGIYRVVVTWILNGVRETPSQIAALCSGMIVQKELAI